MNKNKAQIYLPGLGLNQHLVLGLGKELLQFRSDLSFHWDYVRGKFAALQRVSTGLNITHVPCKPLEVTVRD